MNGRKHVAKGWIRCEAGRLRIKDVLEEIHPSCRLGLHEQSMVLLAENYHLVNAAMPRENTLNRSAVRLSYSPDPQCGPFPLPHPGVNLTSSSHAHQSPKRPRQILGQQNRTYITNSAAPALQVQKDVGLAKH